MEIRENVRQLTKTERKLLDNYSLPYELKSSIEGVWQSSNKPMKEKGKFLMKLTSTVLMLLLLLFPVILLIQFFLSELYSAQKLLFEPLYNVSRFVFWISMILLFFVHLYMSISLSSLKEEQANVKKQGSTDDEELMRRNTIFVPSFLDAFSKKSVGIKIRRFFAWIVVAGGFIITAHYGLFVIYLIVWFWGLIVNGFKKQVIEEEFDLLKNPPQQKSTTVRKSNFMQRLEEAQKKQQEQFKNRKNWKSFMNVIWKSFFLEGFSSSKIYHLANSSAFSIYASRFTLSCKQTKWRNIFLFLNKILD